MRRALLLATLLLAPTTLAWGEGAIVLVRARMDTVFDPLNLGPAWDFTFTVRNDGRPQAAWINIDEVPPVFDLPFTAWHEEPWLETGEEREYTVRVDWSLPESIAFIVGPDWFCLSVDSEWPHSRCWSVLQYVIVPDGVYPENIPHPLFSGPAWGDTA